MFDGQIKTKQALGLESPPIFLGVYPQRIKLNQKTDKKSKVVTTKYTQAYGNWIRKTFKEVEDNIANLKKGNMLSETYQFIKATGIEDFQGVGLDVQASGRPICDLDYSHQHYMEEKAKSRKFDNQENRRKEKAYLSFRKIVGILFQKH